MILLILFSLTAAITLLTQIGIMGMFCKVNIGIPAIGRFVITEWYSFYPAFLFQVFWWVNKYWEYITLGMSGTLGSDGLCRGLPFNAFVR